LVGVTLQDIGYDRRLLRHGAPAAEGPRTRNLLERGLTRLVPMLEQLTRDQGAVDQTLGPEALAQIQCIVEKVAQAEPGDEADRNPPDR
jgi:hypothetical protein